MIRTDARPPITDLDALAFPDYTALPLERYFGLPSMDLMFRHPRWATLLSSRGCPFDCSFCGHALGRTYRARSPNNVLREIDGLVDRHKIGELQIIDDVFNLDRDRTVAICEQLLSRPYRLHLVFPNGLRLDRLDDKLIDLLVRAGLDRLLAPLETGSPRLQRESGKNLDLGKAHAAIAHLARRNVLCRAIIMVGFPDETYDEMKRTVRFAFSTAAQFVTLSQVAPLPGSRLGREFASSGAPGHWHEMNFINTGINLSSVSWRKIQRIKRRVLLGNLRPWRVWKLLRAVPKRNGSFYGRVVFGKVMARLPRLPWGAAASDRRVADAAIGRGRSPG